MAQPRGPKKKDRQAVVPLKGIGSPPAYLDKAAKAHWAEVAALVNESGLGSALDRDALAFYVSLWSRWRAAEAELAKDESDGGREVITANNGYRQLNPWYTISKECLKDMKSYLSEFGLSPKARAKLVLPEAEEVDEKWAEFA
jgi:P27 family predicted phage terminase small subunit